MQTFYISNDCSTIGDVYFLCQSLMQDMIGELSLKKALQSLSNKTFVCTYMHNLKTMGYICTLSISNDCFTIEDILCVIQSSMRFLTGELRPQTCISCFLIHGVCILQTCTYTVLQCTSTHDNKTHVAYDCTLHTKQPLYCQRCIDLYEQSWIATLHVVAPFN